jgi:hypothetical protein
MATGKAAPLAPFDLLLTPPGLLPNAVNDKVSLENDPSLRGELHKIKSYPAGQEKAPGDWTLTIAAGDFGTLDLDMDDGWVVVQYSAAG